MAHVFKIKFGDILRRFSVPMRYDESAAGWTFSELEAKARELFGIPRTSQLVITYLDAENDFVTMADDQDLIDACIVQRLNPLRLEVKVVVSEQSVEIEGKEAPKASVTEFCVENLLKGVFPEATAEAIREILKSYPPRLFTTVPASLLPEALDSFLRTLTGYSETPFVGQQPASSDDPLAQTSAYQQKSEQPRPRNRDSKIDARAPILHTGVQCDGCGMTPIEGPRYKSMKRHDYDLCSICFSELGNETDYHRMDRPMPHKNHCHYCFPPKTGVTRKTMSFPSSRPSFPTSMAFSSRGPCAEIPPYIYPSQSFNAGDMSDAKLDALFVQDVTITDGTELAPGTKFTKIWRVRNVGALPWPQQTQLVHIGGDILGSDEVVNLELPEGGLPSGTTLDISLGLIAPERAGRYVAHWHLMAPSGQRFGHRVWVLIQVVPKGGRSPEVQESLGSKEYVENPQAEGNVFSQDSAVSVESSFFEVQGAASAEPIADLSLKVASVDKGETVEAFHSAGQMGDTDEPQAEENGDLGGFSIVERPLGEESTSDENVVEYDMVQLSNREPALEEPSKEPPLFVPEMQTGLVDEKAFGKPASDSSALVQKDLQSLLEKTTLEKLESMGFVQRDLNIELLAKNNNNFQQTIDDLVISSGWDHMLRDLQEMGFYDMETNRRLLFKNEGSIKRVVKELVEMEKQMFGGKGKEKAARV